MNTATKFQVGEKVLDRIIADVSDASTRLSAARAAMDTDCPFGRAEAIFAADHALADLRRALAIEP